MKRTVFRRAAFLCSLLLICSLGAGNVGQTEVHFSYGVAFGQSGAWKTCPFSITGAWRIDAGVGKVKPFLYEFEPNGVVIVSERTDNGANNDLIPREYEVIGGGRYALDKPEAPKRVEFTDISMDKRGAIPKGNTSQLVVEYSDDNFVTMNEETQALTKWFRAQTQRYFLTFAARGAASPSTFAMWTTFDGRKSKIEALGMMVENHGAAPVFGPIPDRLYREFENESVKASDAMLRLELTEAEFDRSHKVFESWARFAQAGKLPHADHYLNGMEFLRSVTANLNQCDERIKPPPADSGAAGQNPHQQGLEHVRALRKKNKGAHITDGLFPVDWRPAPLQN